MGIPACPHVAVMNALRRTLRRPSDPMFRLLVENIGDVLWFKEGTPPAFTYLSPAFESIWHHSVQAAYADTALWEQSIHPDDQKSVSQALHLWFTGQTPDYQAEYRIVNRLGQTRWIADRGIILSRRDGNPFQIAGIARDITERQLNDLQRARLAAVVESSEDAIMTLDLDGRIQTWNAGAEAIFGYSASEVIGQPVALLRPPEAADDEAVFKQRISQGQRIQHYETRRRRKDGTLIDISLSISPLRDRQGRLTGFSKISRDITRRRRAELMLHRWNADLEARVRERTAALSRAYDELQTLVETRRQLEREVLSISEHEQRRIGQDLHDDLGQQIAGAWMMSSVLERTLARRTAPETPSAARIAALLEQALSRTRSLARGLHPVAPEEGGLETALRQLAAHGKELFAAQCQFAARGSAPSLDPDTATHLYRIAQEALSNAAKHGRASRIHLTLHSTPDQLNLRVTDNGTGFAPPEPNHTGFGLRIMRYRADMIGATLDIRSRSPRGTSLRCTLPLHPRPPHA